MSILHIIRNRNDAVALDTIRLQSEHGENGGDVGVLLIHDAVFDIADEDTSIFPAGVKLHALSSDCDARTISQVDEGGNSVYNYDCVDYDAMLKLIFEYDKVITW